MVVAFAAAAFAFQFVPKVSAPALPAQMVQPVGQLLPSPSAVPESSALISHALKNGDLVLFGSSELSNPGETAIQTLYPVACGKRVLAVGRAGFQNLPILKTLAHVRDSLSDKSNVAIILSPVWFTERGTPSEAFLGTLRPHELSDLLRAPDLPATVKSALNLEIQEHRDEFTGLYPDYLFAVLPALARFTAPYAPDFRGVSFTQEPLPAHQPYDWDAAATKWRADLLQKSKAIPLARLPNITTALRNTIRLMRLRS